MTWHNIDDKLPPTGKLVEVKFLYGMRVFYDQLRLEYHDGKRQWFQSDGVLLTDIEPVYWREVE